MMNHKHQQMKLFRNNNTSSNNLDITYLDEESTQYDLLIPWKNSYSGNNFLQWVREKFGEFDNNEIQQDKHIFFFKNESTCAFRINTEVLDLSPGILWNYWKDEIQDSGYILKNSEIIKKDKLTTKRYYLKPKLKYKVERNQLFGNITLELIKNKAMPKYIMLKCSWYRDRNFLDAAPFQDLVKLLTN